MDWLYDKKGQALLFIYGDRFISKNGKNLGWIFNNNVYGLKNGKHLGWFENGVLYDGMNKVIAFSRNASGYMPSRPGFGGVPGTPGIPGRRPGRRDEFHRCSGQTARFSDASADGPERSPAGL